MKRIKGQALFLRALSYYNLVGYYQNPPLITDYATYSSLNGLYGANSTYDAVLDQVEKDFRKQLGLLPSRDEGSEWSADVPPAVLRPLLCPRPHDASKYSEALPVLKDIIGKKYGTYN